MKIRSVLAAMVVFASMLTSEAAFAAPAAFNAPVHAMFSKPRMVSFNVHNASTEPMKIKAGASEMTLLPGATAPVKLAVGESVIAQETTKNYTAGSVLVTVSNDISDATITLN